MLRGAFYMQRISLSESGLCTCIPHFMIILYEIKNPNGTIGAVKDDFINE